jgi:hypothetical protein
MDKANDAYAMAKDLTKSEREKFLLNSKVHFN